MNLYRIAPVILLLSGCPTPPADTRGVCAFGDGVACDDGDPCTMNDICKAGSCVAGPLVKVDDGNACTVDSCTKTEGIKHVALPAGTVITAATDCQQQTTCDAAGNAKAGAFAADGTVCDDGVFNNKSSYCKAGSCKSCEYGNCFGANQPWSCSSNNCVDQNGVPDLSCWLNQHPRFKDHLNWYDPATDPVKVWLSYEDWQPWRKQALQAAFVAAWQWMQSGMTTYTGTVLPDPLTNLESPYMEQNYLEQRANNLVVDEQTAAWPLYIARAAHSFAMEIGHWVPWSMCDYNSAQVANVLRHDFFPSAPGQTSAPGFHMNSYSASPSHPTYVFKFFHEEQLIGPSRLKTIGRLIEWSARLAHTYPPVSCQNLPPEQQTRCYSEAFWNYDGGQSVSRTIEGVALPDIEPIDGVQHWTNGCGGTTDFMRTVLRDMNIPVEPKVACQHIVPSFPSEGMFLTHGDDPYGLYDEIYPSVDGITAPPGEALLIDQATWNAWFTDPTQACVNVGRSGLEMAVEIPPHSFVVDYCEDKMARITDHAQSSVYQNYYVATVGNQTYPVLTVAELEARMFWETLESRAAALGGCCQIIGCTGTVPMD